jgi:undecaprenyl phosphate N,N'-diacetylbacillosamine 1-phosphate transferase
MEVKISGNSNELKNIYICKKGKKFIYKKYFKRPIDIILALFAIMILSPVLLIVVILVRINLGNPIIFKQKRPGLNEEVFTLYKFRTMTEEKDSNGNLLSDDDRLTDFGKKLRSTSLDELPELINIIKGDMSFVGPRPLLVRYLPLYNNNQRKRHYVRPGLTGIAQINGRNALTWERRFKLDTEYVNTINFLLDLKIIIKTIINVFKKENIDFETGRTQTFNGS